MKSLYLQSNLIRSFAPSFFLRRLSYAASAGAGARVYSSKPVLSPSPLLKTKIEVSDESESLFHRLDWEHFVHDDGIIENIKRRHETSNIDSLRQLWKQLQIEANGVAATTEKRRALEAALVEEALKIPNDTHPASIECGDTPKVLRTTGKPPSIEKPRDIQELCESRGYLKRNNLGDLIGLRPYVLKGFLAELEQALINYTVEVLKDEGFEFITVPDFLYSDVIESCGFPVNTDRTMIYEIETEKGETPIYLSGTSEMGIAGYLSNRTFSKSELPLKLAALSRCFRAETSSIEEERGIYRVHNFSKVEMFIVTDSEGSGSDELHNYICNLQERLFSDLGLHFRVMEMSANELGSPAYRKFDIEAWMPGRKKFGEISSCSNCTDYQSRRLNIRYERAPGETPLFVHTLNGTACAIPRMLIAVIESCQNDEGNVVLPQVLQKRVHTKWSPKSSDIFKETFLRSRKQQEKVICKFDPWRE